MLLNLHAFGSNGSGQLGIGHRDDVSRPTPCSLEPHNLQRTDARIKSVKYLRAGGNHTLLLAEDGHAFTAGDYDKDVRANIEKQNESGSWRRLVIENNVVGICDRFSLISATWAASFFVTVGRNRIISLGNGNKGELGLDKDLKTTSNPVTIPKFPPVDTQIVDIASCMSHTAVVLSNGEVWGWGGGRKGQLGEPAENVWKPRRIEHVPFKAVKVACGREFTVIASPPDDGSFVVLGAEKWQIQSSAPASIEGWRQIEAGWSAVYVLMRDGRLLSWGRNDYGQLSKDGTPRLTAVAAGSEHVLCLTENHEVLAYGWDEHGNCGPDATEGAINRPVYGERTTFVGAGCATSFVLVEADNYGQFRPAKDEPERQAT